jgi:DNA-directed RNA polymerase subunit RPC12/RpoP
MRATIVGGGGRREIQIVCPECQHPSQLPPSAVLRNQFFCSRCGKSLDLSNVFRSLSDGQSGGPSTVGRDRGESRYKSARKARR